MHLIPRNTQSVQNDITRGHDQWDADNLLKLKEALKKLESPEKRTKENKKENKQNIIEKINKSRSRSTRVVDLVKPREIESQNCSRNSSVVFRITENTKHRSTRPSFFQLNKCKL